VPPADSSRLRALAGCMNRRQPLVR
jgi:hypothetical protein